MLNRDSVVARSAALMSADIGSAVVVLHLGRNEYFDTDATGAEVWRRLESPVRVSEIVDDLLEAYDVTRDDCERDVLAFLEDALARDMVMVVAPDAAASSAPTGR